MKKPNQSSKVDPGLAQYSALSTQHLEVVIEELVLHGFAPGDRYRIARAVEHELMQLFTEQGVKPSLVQGSEVAHLDGGAFKVAPRSKAEAIGAQVAQAIYGGLSR